MRQLTSGREAARIAQEIERDRKRAEWFLLHAQEERAAYERAREEYLAKGSRSRTAGSDPTSRAALRGLAFDRRSGACRWLRAVEVMEQELTEERRLFLVLRRRAQLRRGNGFARGRHGWVVWVQQEFLAEMERRGVAGRYLGERTVEAWWRGMVFRTAEIWIRLEK